MTPHVRLMTLTRHGKRVRTAGGHLNYLLSIANRRALRRGFKWIELSTAPATRTR